MEPNSTVTSLNDRGFRLISGEYALTFDAGRLWLARTGAAEGLAFAILQEGGLDALRHVQQRHVAAMADRPTVTLAGAHDWAAFTLTFDADPAHPGLFHWRFAVTPQGTPPVYDPQPELAFTAESRVTLYAQQAPMAAGLTYLYEGALLDSTLFYFQDQTALNDYFTVSHARPLGQGLFPVPLPHLPSGIVGYADGRLGLKLPGAGLSALPVGAPTVISDGYLALTPGPPADEPTLARRFLHDLAAIYRRIARPATELVNWRDLAQRTLADLPDPRNWVEVAGQPFLRAYVNCERDMPELITQLDVLTSLRDYCAHHTTAPAVRQLDRRLINTLPFFYSPEAQAMLNQPFAARRESDSWYLVTGLVDLSRLARGGDAQARRLLMDSVERVTEIAHRCGYAFPIFLDPTGQHEIPPPEPPLHPPQEYDVAGAYAYLMLDLFEETGTMRYLREAQAAVESLRGHGFDLAYELHVTALAATACARLYRLTGECSYVELSLVPLANVLRHCWLWECTYGHAVGYRTFFGLLPMTYAAVITPKEQYETWQNLVEYLRLAHGVAPAAVELLVAEFCRHTLHTMRSAFAPLLPPASMAARPRLQPSVKQAAPELYIPLEDIRDGWEQSGNIGQELYGAGMALTFAARGYVPIRPGLTVHSEYPLVAWDAHTFTLGGLADWPVRVAVLGDVVGIAGSDDQTIPTTISEEGLALQAQGGRTYRVLA